MQITDRRPAEGGYAFPRATPEADSGLAGCRQHDSPKPEEEEEPEPEYDPGDECDDEGGMSGYPHMRPRTRHARAASVRPGQLVGRAMRARSRGRCVVCRALTLPGQFIGRTVGEGWPREQRGKWVHVACVVEPPDGTQGELWP